MGRVEDAEFGYSTATPALEGEVTQDNLGELLLLGYADFLGRYKFLTARADNYKQKAEQLDGLAMPALRGIIDSMVVGQSEHPEIVKVSREAKEAAVEALVYRAAARIIEHERGHTLMNDIVDRQHGVTMSWPLGKKVEISDPSLNLIHTLRPSSSGYVSGERVRSVEGHLSYVEFSEGRNTAGLVKIEGKRGKMFNVTPLIERPAADRPYRSLVEIKFL